MRKVAVPILAFAAAFGGWILINGNQHVGSSQRDLSRHRDEFVRECMEASIGWREGTNGWYDTSTPEYRVRLREICTNYFVEDFVNDVMQAVRDGELEVRGQRAP